MIRSATNFIRCNQCSDKSRCDAEGCCMALVEQERRRNRLAMDQLTPGERFALMFGHKLTKKMDCNEKI